MTAVLLTVESNLSSTWAWWNCHQASGTTLTERNAKSGYTGQTINGTTTNIWTSNPGYFTPDPTAGNYVSIPQATADNLFALDTLTAGGVLIMATVNIPSNPGSGSEYLFWYGGTNGNYTIRFNYGGNININSDMENVDGTSINLGSSTINDYAGAGDFTVALYADVSNGQWSVYAFKEGLPNSMDRYAIAQKTRNMPTDGTAKPGTTISSSWGMGLFGQGNGGGGATNLGVPGGITHCRDILAVRFTTDASSYVPEILQQYRSSNGIYMPRLLEEF